MIKNIANVKKYLSTERTHLFTPNINIIMKVRIVGDVNTDNLIEAIKAAIKINESLNCRIILSEGGQAWYERCENAANLIKVSHKDWRDIVKDEESIAFKLEDGELVRIFILTCGKDTELLIIAHHLAGDGLSIVYLIKDIMNAFSGKSLKFKPLNLASVDDFPKNTRLSFLIKMYLRHINRSFIKDGRVFTYDDYNKMFNMYWYNRSTCILEDRLKKEELTAIYHMAKCGEVSVNSIISTAFIYAYGKKADTGFAISLRKDGNEAMANHTSGIDILYKYNENKSFMENAKEVHKLIYKKLNNDKIKYFVPHFLSSIYPCLIDSASMAVYGEYKNKTAKKLADLMQYNEKSKDISITNLTKLKIPKVYGSFEIDDFMFVAPVIPYGKRIIGIATLGENMCITMHVMNDSHLGYEKMIFEKAINILKNIKGA